MRVRIEFLTEQLLIEARGSSAARQRLEKAYSQVSSPDKSFDGEKKEGLVSLAKVMTKLGPMPLFEKEMVAASKPKKPSKNSKSPFTISSDAVVVTRAVEAQSETIQNAAPPLKVTAPFDRAAVLPIKDTEKDKLK